MRIYLILYTICYICYAQTCPDCRGDGSDTSLLQVDSRPPPDAPGIIIWSYGRSGTGSLKKSLISATGYTYCRNMGEPFADRAPNIQSLQRCMRKGQLLLMIKPQHLFEHGGALQRPQDFFQAAFQASWWVRDIFFVFARFTVGLRSLVFLSPPNAEDFVKLQGWLSHCCWKLPGEPTGEGFVFL